MSDLSFDEMRILAETRHQSLIEEAEQWRLAKRRSPAGRPIRPVYGPALAGAGTLLIRIGNRLQARYTRASAEVGDSLDGYAAGNLSIL